MEVRSRSCLFLVVLLPILVYGDVLFTREPRLRGAEILEFGIYEWEEGDRPPIQVEGNATIYGRLRRQLIEKTDQIPAKLGTHFGLRYRLLARGPDRHKSVEIGVIWIIPAPGIKDPASGAITRFLTYKNRKSVNISSYVGFTIDREEEIVEGLWKVAIIDNDENILLEKEFYIHKPQ